MVVQAIYISLFIGRAKSCQYSALLHISSSVRSESNAAVRERPTLFRQSETNIISAGKTDILSSQTEMPNAAKTTLWILLVRSELRDGNRIFANPDNFIFKAEKTNLLVNVSLNKDPWLSRLYRLDRPGSFRIFSFFFLIVTFQPNEWISCNLFCTLRIYVISSISR